MSQVIEAIIEVFITMMGVYLFGTISLKDKLNNSKMKFILSFVLAVGLNTIIYLNLIGTLKTIMIMLVCIMFYKKAFQITLSKSIFLTLIYFISLIASELIQIFFITNVLGMSTRSLYSDFMKSILGSLTTLIVLIVLTLILKKPLRYLINTKVATNRKILIYSVLTIVCSIAFFYKIISEFKISNDIIGYLVAIVMLVTVLIGLIRQAIDNVILSEKYENVLDYMSGYEHEVENQRIVRHEAKNELIIIKSKICDGESSKELMDYIDEILDEKVEFRDFSKIKVTL